MYEAAYHDRSFVFDEGCGSISETDTITPQQAVENVVDIQSLVDMYIISELTCDADLYWSSFFLEYRAAACSNFSASISPPFSLTALNTWNSVFSNRSVMS